MGRCCDLHAHTTASDGDLSPVELVAHAVELGLGALGVTDHDTVGGLDEAISAAADAGLPLAPGVEISAEFSPGTMHVLGYFVDHRHTGLLEALEELRGGRDVRNKKIIARLQDLDLDITYDEVLAVAGEETVGRPHFARVMVEKGFVSGRQEAFDRYLAKGAPAYFDRLRLGPEESVRLIREARGLPVLAHPQQLGVSDEELESIVKSLIPVGLAGVEAYYTSHSPEQTAFYLSLAEKYGLLVTGGSDYHGPNRPDIQLGSGAGDLDVPVELFDRLHEAAVSN